MRNNALMAMTSVPFASAFFVFASFFSSGIFAAQAFEAAVRAPVGCIGGTRGCREDISLFQAQKLAHGTSHSVKECLKNNRGKLGDQRHQAETRDQTCLARAATEHTECDKSTATDYAWATADDLSDGAEALASLQRNAESGKVFKQGLLIVEAAESPPGEQHLALCGVRTIKGVAGPPLNCATVAIKTPTVTLLRVSRGDASCEKAGYFRPSGGINIDFQIETKLDALVFSDSLGSMLSEELGLSTAQDVVKKLNGETDSVLWQATVSLRDSKILPGGWRESLDFDLHLLSRFGTITVRAFAKPMVCRTASGTLTDYRAPDDAQRGIYAAELNRRVNDAITRVCTRFTQRDDKTIICQ